MIFYDSSVSFYDTSLQIWIIYFLRNVFSSYQFIAYCRQHESSLTRPGSPTDYSLSIREFSMCHRLQDFKSRTISNLRHELYPGRFRREKSSRTSRNPFTYFFSKNNRLSSCSRTCDGSLIVFQSKLCVFIGK